MDAIDMEILVFHVMFLAFCRFWHPISLLLMEKMSKFAP